VGKNFAVLDILFQIQISKKYIGIAQGIVPWEQRGAGHYARVTGSDVTGNGPDRKEVT
jgi:hypothetical protein